MSLEYDDYTGPYLIVPPVAVVRKRWTHCCPDGCEGGKLVWRDKPFDDRVPGVEAPAPALARASAGAASDSTNWLKRLFAPWRRRSAAAHEPATPTRSPIAPKLERQAAAQSSGPAAPVWPFPREPFCANCDSKAVSTTCDEHVMGEPARELMDGLWNPEVFGVHVPGTVWLPYLREGWWGLYRLPETEISAANCAAFRVAYQDAIANLRRVHGVEADVGFGQLSFSR